MSAATPLVARAGSHEELTDQLTDQLTDVLWSGFQHVRLAPASTVDAR